MVPEELPAPTPAKAPRNAEPGTSDSLVPELPMTPDLPEAAPRPSTQQSPTLAPPFGETPASPPSGVTPQVPVFGDEPQAPPSAADPLRSPFSDEPPQPPADVEEPLPGTESAPAPAAPAPGSPGATPPGAVPADIPAEGPAGNESRSGMPFDVGAPQMPADDPFKDDPNQEPNKGARLEQAYRETYGIARTDPSVTADSVGTEEPRLLHADGGSLDAARLPAEQSEPNPLRQVSHPVRRTMATETLVPPSKPTASWRRNPLRAR